MTSVSLIRLRTPRGQELCVRWLITHLQSTMKLMLTKYLLDHPTNGQWAQQLGSSSPETQDINSEGKKPLKSKG